MLNVERGKLDLCIKGAYDQIIPVQSVGFMKLYLSVEMFLNICTYLTILMHNSVRQNN